MNLQYIPNHGPLPRMTGAEIAMLCMRGVVKFRVNNVQTDTNLIKRKLKLPLYHYDQKNQAVMPFAE
jgi:hypothetical protein